MGVLLMQVTSRDSLGNSIHSHDHQVVVLVWREWQCSTWVLTTSGRPACSPGTPRDSHHEQCPHSTLYYFMTEYKSWIIFCLEENIWEMRENIWLSSCTCLILPRTIIPLLPPLSPPLVDPWQTWCTCIISSLNIDTPLTLHLILMLDSNLLMMTMIVIKMTIMMTDFSQQINAF